jgi:uncharacterized HAD superfamily protein
MNKKFGSFIDPLTVDTFHWHTIPGVPFNEKEYIKELTEEFEYKSPLIPGAKEAVWALSELDDICYLTARPKWVRMNTNLQLSDFPPGELVMVDRSHEKLDYVKSKKLPYNVMIDDHPGTALAFAEAGIAVYMPSRLHNKDVAHNNIVRVKEIVEVPQFEFDKRVEIICLGCNQPGSINDCGCPAGIGKRKKF